MTATPNHSVDIASHDITSPRQRQALSPFVYRLAKVRGHRGTWSGCIMRETEKGRKH